MLCCYQFFSIVQKFDTLVFSVYIKNFLSVHIFYRSNVLFEFHDIHFYLALRNQIVIVFDCLHVNLKLLNKIEKGTEQFRESINE